RAGGGSEPGTAPVAFESDEIRGESLWQLRRRPAEPLAERGDALARREELRRGQEDRLLQRGDGSLVGRVECPQRIDLVTEELDPDRQCRGRRKDIHDPATAGELAPTSDLGGGRIAE